MSLKEVLASVKNSFQFKKEVKIKGSSYELAVLSMGQEKKVNAYLDTLDQDNTVEYLNELRKAVLSEAITVVNGEKIDSVIKDTDKDGKQIEKDKAIFIKEFLNELPSIVITELFEAYVDVKDELDNILKKEMKYDWFKTPEQRDKEIEEARKKVEEEEKAAAANKETKEEKEPEVQEIKLTKVTETAGPEPEPAK